jgi:hypothetical protein
MVESDPVFTGAYYNFNLHPFAGYPEMQGSGYTRQPHEVPVFSTAQKSSNYTFVFEGQTYYQDYTFTYLRRWCPLHEKFAQVPVSAPARLSQCLLAPIECSPGTTPNQAANPRPF